MSQAKILPPARLLQGMIVTLALLLSLHTLRAQEETDDFSDLDDVATYGGRYANDLGLQVNGYLWVPLFNIDPNSGIKETNLGLGGGANLAVIYYLTPLLGIGGFLDIAISAPANQVNIQNYFLSVMLGARISYDINIYAGKYLSHPLFSIPLGFGIAMSAAKYDQITNLIPVIKFDAGLYINPFSEAEWSFGFSLHYWFAPEFTKVELSRIANYLMIGIGFTFHSGL